MKSKSIFITAFILSAFLLGGLAHAATVLTFGHEDPPDGIRHKAAMLFAKKVEQYTQGRYKIDIHHSATLGSGPKLLEQEKLGAIDFVNTGTAIYSNQVPELTLLTLPYLVESYEQGWALYDRSPWVKHYMNKLSKKNIHYLGMWEAGFRQLTTKFPVKSPADVKDLKVRVSKNKVYLWLWQALGANPTVVPFGELYLSLQQGVVDAQETPINTIQVYKFYEITPYINLTYHIYGPQPLSVNEKRWQSFSKEDQVAIQRAAFEAGALHRLGVRDLDSKRLEDIVAKGGKINKVDVTQFSKLVKPVYEKAKDKFPKEVVNWLTGDADRIKKMFPVK